MGWRALPSFCPSVTSQSCPSLLSATNQTISGGRASQVRGKQAGFQLLGLVFLLFAFLVYTALALVREKEVRFESHAISTVLRRDRGHTKKLSHCNFPRRHAPTAPLSSPLQTERRVFLPRRLSHAPRHWDTRPSPTLSLQMDARSVRRGWQGLGTQAAIARDVTAVGDPEPTGEPTCHLHAIARGTAGQAREANKLRTQSQGQPCFLWQDRSKEKQTPTSKDFLLP